jgi:hypothetical protein
MLTRIITARGLVNQHQLTPAEKVSEVKFPGSSFLPPFLLNSHFMINLEIKFPTEKHVLSGSALSTVTYYKCVCDMKQKLIQMLLPFPTSKCQQYPIGINTDIHNTKMNYHYSQMSNLYSTRN